MERLLVERPLEEHPELVLVEYCMVVLPWGEASNMVLLPEDEPRAV